MPKVRRFSCKIVFFISIIACSIGFGLAVGHTFADSSPQTESLSLPMIVPSLCAGAGLWSEQGHPTASDGAANDRFGYAVAISGDTAIVGSYQDDTPGGSNAGSAYVYTRSGTAWTQQQKLTASDGAASDNFGISVSINGDTAIIGAHNDDDAGASSGSAYVFTRSGTVWTQQQKLTASDAAAGDQFGVSVGVSANTVIIGAYFDDNAGGTDAGAAYVFTRSGSVWTQQQKLTASDAAASDFFGNSVAIDGETVIAGAYSDDNAGGTDAGAAYVFTRSGTVWSQQQKLTASDGAASARFGTSVAVSEDTVIAGAYLADTAGGTDAGAAYSFTRSGTVWAQEQILTASDGAPSDDFGYSVSLSGDTAVVGSLLNDSGAGTSTGSAYVFKRFGNFWDEDQQLTASDAAGGDQFGQSVGVDGDTVVVGALLDDTTGGADAGSAYIFTRSCVPTINAVPVLVSPGAGVVNSTIANVNDVEQALNTLTVTINGGASATQNGITVNNITVSPSGVVTADVVAAAGASDASFTLTVTDNTALSSTATLPVIIVSQCSPGGTWNQQAQPLASDGGTLDLFGYSVAVSGNTAIVGARDDVNGAAYVYVRNGTAWTQQQKLTASDGAAADRFGQAVTIIDDTAVIGADAEDNAGGTNAGSVYVFTRSGSTWTEQQKLIASDGAANDLFGSSIALGDDTVIVGASFEDNAGGANAGSAYVFTRTGTVWTQQQKIISPDGEASDFFGNAVAISGDTVVIGAYLKDSAFGSQDIGSAYIFLRSGTVWGLQKKLTASDSTEFDYFGSSVAISGGTVVVGAYLEDNAGGINAGSAYVFIRSGDSWTQQQKITASDGTLDDRFGYSVAISGNTLVVGAPVEDNADTDAGAVYVFTRNGTVWTQRQKLTASDAAGIDQFGYSVALTDDTAVVGAPFDNTTGGTDAGSAYIFTRTCFPSISSVLVVRSPGAGASSSTIANVTDGEQALNTLAVTVNGGASATQNGVTVNNIGVSPSGIVTADVVAVAGASDASFTLTVTDNTALSSTATLTAIVLSECPPTGTWNQQAQPTASDGAASDNFGGSVAISGETLVVGAPEDDNARGTDAGAAYVFTRSGTTWTLQQKLIASDIDSNDNFGNSVSINGDTLVIGSDDGNISIGQAYVFTRSGTVWTEQQKLTPPDGAGSDRFGISVSVSGDTAIVGSYRNDPAAITDAGTAYVFTRSGTVWALQQKLTASDRASLDNFGFSVAINGDTVIVGAWQDDHAGGSNAGAAYVFTRSGTVWTQQQKLTASDATSNDLFGSSVSISGDTVVAGAYQEGLTITGAAYVFTRSGTVWTQQQKLTASDGADGDSFGISVSLSGDTVVVGASGDESFTGSAYVFSRSGTTWTQRQKLIASDGATNDNFGISVSASGDSAIIGSYLNDTTAGTDAGSAYIFKKDCPAPTPTSTNTSTPTGTATNTPTPAETPSLNGTVTYGNPASPTTKFISNAAVNGAGSPNVFTTTAAPGGTAGQYLLTGFGAGSYTVSVSKTTGQNGISSADAARIAQHVAGTLFITTDRQRIAADVTNNGALSSTDAAQIARFVAALGPPIGLAGQWRFFVPSVTEPTFPIGASPTSRSYTDPIGNPTGQDFIGILVGEVTGNWNPTAARPGTVNSEQWTETVDRGQWTANSEDKTQNPIAVMAQSVVSAADKEIVVPVKVEGIVDKGVISYEFNLRYDPSVMQPVGDVVDVKGTVSRGLSVVTNASEPGLLRVVVYGAYPIDGDGVLLNLRFDAAGSVGSFSPISFERIMFNEGESRVAVTDGRVELF